GLPVRHEPAPTVARFTPPPALNTPPALCPRPAPAARRPPTPPLPDPLRRPGAGQGATGSTSLLRRPVHAAGRSGHLRRHRPALLRLRPHVPVQQGAGRRERIAVRGRTFFGFLPPARAAFRMVLRPT